MKISAFTPSHKSLHLDEVYACLSRQTHTDWEWVVVPNGLEAGIIRDKIKAITEKDKRVKLCLYPATGSLNIGALKQFACSNCSGELLLELDHDDVITDDCLELVAKAANNALSNCFIYSENITATSTNESHIFDSNYGWRHYNWDYKKVAYTGNKTFPITPRSLCEILYAPDHVRVWSQEAYRKTGGHQRTLRVGDDHDLIVRTYLAGAAFIRIPQVTYIHRLDANNTSSQSLDEIAKVSHHTRDVYLHALVAEWCKRHGLHMLDLGGAHNCPPGYTPVDYNLPKTGKPVVDFTNGISANVFELDTLIPDNSIGCFRASDFLEHIPIGRVVPLLNMLYRKLVPGGYLLSNTPAVCDNEGRCGRGAFQDPTHCSFWSSNNTWYFTKREYAKYVPGVACRFQSIVLANYYPSPFHVEHLIPYLRWDAMALKDDENNYYPGVKEI